MRVIMTQLLFNLTTNSAAETEAVGARLAEQMLAEGSDIPRFVALYGDLGSGKTAFVRGFVSVISPKTAVRSPTFTIVNEYRGGRVPVFHFDMYRIDGDDDLYSIGFYDYLSNGICLSEWSENIEFALPDEYVELVISRTAEVEENPDRRSLVAKIIKY